MNQDLINGLIGWSTGYAFTIENRREAEIQQGKNYYLASLMQTTQLGQLWVVIQKINETVPKNLLTTPVKILANVVPLLSLPVFVYAASVRSGENEKFAEWFNATDFSYVKLPETLGERSVSFLSFIAEHSGNIFRVAMVASSVALIVLGNAAFGAAILTALAYEVIDSMGYVPRRISLFMEIYMPTVSLLGLVIGGTAVIQIYSAIMLSTHILPCAAAFIHQKVDALTRYSFSLKGPSLSEIDAPLVEKKEMTFDEINQILDCYSNDLEINPAHCSHSIVELEDLPKDDDFDQFLTLFDQVHWELNYVHVFNKLKDDDRFLDFLLEKFKKDNESLQKEELQAAVEHYIELTADEKGVSKERFVVDWTREQMVVLIDLLKGNTRVEGLQQDLDEAIQAAAILLPHITSLTIDVDREDALLKLAIEGGAYCGRGIKRSANEIMRGVIAQKLMENQPIVDPIKDYELRILQGLQNQRHMIVEGFYQDLMQELNIPDEISQDTHGFDVYYLYLSLGVCPVSTHERRRIGLAEILVWELYNNARQRMYELYRDDMEEVVKDVGEIYFADYMRKAIHENTELTDDEKDALIEKFTERNDGKWSVWETNERFHNLMFVQLGVLRPVSAVG